MDASSFRHWLNRLRLADIIALSEGHILFSNAERRSKKLIVEKLLSTPSAKDLVLSLCQHAQERSKDWPNKRRRHNAMTARDAQEGNLTNEDEVTNDLYDSTKYLELPTRAEVRAAYKVFYQATSSSSVQSAICGICARECGPLDEQVMTYSLEALPNPHRLAPLKQHPLHDLYNGKLLEPAGVVGDAGHYMVNACSTCLDDLTKKKDVPPQFALANNLWIGSVPWQIQVLSFPEQLLVSLIYPRVFVFKLFPKKVGGIRDLSTLQRAMRGNVTSYAMDTTGVADMVEGRMLPRHPRLLASLISVTYVGPGELPKPWLQKIFCVRRHTVHAALKWLKANNPYYADIDISHANLEDLPEDDVPYEISTTMRQSTDVSIIDQENNGYVPDDEGQ